MKKDITNDPEFDLCKEAFAFTEEFNTRKDHLIELLNSNFEAVAEFSIIKTHDSYDLSIGIGANGLYNIYRKRKKDKAAKS